MRLMLVLLAFCFVAASANACPNLAGQYLREGEDGVVRYTVRQSRCRRVEVVTESTYLGKTSNVETQEYIVDGKTHGNSSEVCRWTDNKLQIGKPADHVYYGVDSNGNLHMSDGRSYPQCGGPCDEVARRINFKL